MSSPLRSPVIWIVLAVMAVSGAVVAAGTVYTRERVLRVERQICRSEVSCQRLLNRLLRYATPRQKRAIVEALPNIRERLRRQIPPKDRPAPGRRVAPPPRTENPTPAPAPGAPVPGPAGPKGEPGPAGPPGRPAPPPVPPVTTPEVPEVPDLPKLPPLPQPVCDLLPVLCPK